MCISVFSYIDITLYIDIQHWNLYIIASHRFATSAIAFKIKYFVFGTLWSWTCICNQESIIFQGDITDILAKAKALFATALYGMQVCSEDYCQTIHRWVLGEKFCTAGASPSKGIYRLRVPEDYLHLYCTKNCFFYVRFTGKVNTSPLLLYLSFTPQLAVLWL